MTATRDDRGRFVSAQEFAANEVLKAAVRRAVDMIRERDQYPLRIVLGMNQPPETLNFDPGSLWLIPDDQPQVTFGPDPVVTMLAEAGRSAELLLDGGAK